jgi:hypothetical protein
MWTYSTDLGDTTSELRKWVVVQFENCRPSAAQSAMKIRRLRHG